MNFNFTAFIAALTLVSALVIIIFGLVILYMYMEGYYEDELDKLNKARNWIIIGFVAAVWLIAIFAGIIGGLFVA